MSEPGDAGDGGRAGRGARRESAGDSRVSGDERPLSVNMLDEDRVGASTAEAAALVTAVDDGLDGATPAPGAARRRHALDALTAAGLEHHGACVRLSKRPGLMHHSEFLQDFTPTEADILGEAMPLFTAREGQVLIAEDEASDWMMILLEGTVDVTKRRVGQDPADAPWDEQARLSVLRPGAIVGAMSMLDGEPRYATARALAPCEIAVLTREAVAGLITDHPGVGAKVLVKITQLLAQRLRNTSNQLVKALQRMEASGGR